MVRQKLAYFFLMLGLCIPQLISAQIINKKPAPGDTAALKRVRILNADSLVFRKTEGESIQRLIGKVKMQQDSTLFFCDSAYFYEDKNLIKAYSKVKVIMSDSVTLYADRLNYDGDTRIAEVYNNILLTDLKSELRTNRMTYYRDAKYGKFIQGGTLTDDESVLTSDRGYYYPDNDKAYFKGLVTLEHPDYVLETDTMGYNTETKVAEFLTYTLITSDDGIIETTKGTYDTEAKEINLIERSTIQDSSYTMDANTIRYDSDENLGIATGDVLVSQEDSSLELRGQFGIFNRDTDESTLTQDPVAIQYMEEDTLYIFADTLSAFKEKIVPPPPKATPILPDSVTKDSLDRQDSISYAPPLQVDRVEKVAVEEPDTIERRVFKGHYQVRFFMNEMQGRCDSMIYFYDDSTIYLYESPVLWSEQGQITGDTIKIWMKNNQIDSMWVGPNGFLVSEADTVGFDQIKGAEFRAKFRDNELAYLHVIGNAESMYYIKEEDSTGNNSYEGMNEASSQEMILYFGDNELQKILFKAQPKGVYSPIHEVIFKEKKLKGMKWRIEEKPERPDLLVIEDLKEAKEEEPELPAEGPGIELKDDEEEEDEMKNE